MPQTYRETGRKPPPDQSWDDPDPLSYPRASGVANPRPEGEQAMRRKLLPEPASPRSAGKPSLPYNRSNPSYLTGRRTPGGTGEGLRHLSDELSKGGTVRRPENPVPAELTSAFASTFVPTHPGQVRGVRPQTGQSGDPTHRPDLESTQSGVRRRLASTPITPPTQPMGLPSATPTPPPGGPQPQGAGMPTDIQLEQLIRSLVGSEGNPRKMPRPELPLPGDPRGRPGAIGVARPGMGPNPQPMLGGPSNSLRRRGR